LLRLIAADPGSWLYASINREPYPLSMEGRIADLILGGIRRGLPSYRVDGRSLASKIPTSFTPEPATRTVPVLSVEQMKAHWDAVLKQPPKRRRRER